eukprot:80982-Alexandrium_andersonii.AAC.1
MGTPLTAGGRACEDFHVYVQPEAALHAYVQPEAASTFTSSRRPLSTCLSSQRPLPYFALLASLEDEG